MFKPGQIGDAGVRGDKLGTNASYHSVVMVTPDALPRAFSIAVRRLESGISTSLSKGLSKSTVTPLRYECENVGVDGCVVEEISIYKNRVSWSQSRICN